MRARKFDVQRSYAMYTAALRWRKSVSLDHLYRTFDWKRAQSAARVGYPQYFHKTDRSGSPVHIHEICNVDLNKVRITLGGGSVNSVQLSTVAQGELIPSLQLFKLISPEEQVKYMYLLNESNFRERFPGCTEELRRQRARPINGQSATSDTDDVENPSEMEAREIREVETVTGILDIKNVGLMGFWKVKDLLGQVIQISDVRLFRDLVDVMSQNRSGWEKIQKKRVTKLVTRSRTELLSGNVQPYGEFCPSLGPTSECSC